MDDVHAPAVTLSVLLEHTTEDGRVHLDWMIERPGSGDERRLVTFRCRDDPLAAPRWTGERLDDHRAIYLAFEGEIGGGRGRVRRVWTRRCRVLEECPAGFVVDLAPGGPAREIRVVRPTGGGVWSIDRGGEESVRTTGEVLPGGL